MLSVVMLSVVKLSVVAPWIGLYFHPCRLRKKSFVRFVFVAIFTSLGRFIVLTPCVVKLSFKFTLTFLKKIEIFQWTQDSGNGYRIKCQCCKNSAATTQSNKLECLSQKKYFRLV
jgi:hypothetical protein